MSASSPESALPATTPVFVVLSGRRRGEVVRLDDKTIRLFRGADADIRFLPPETGEDTDFHATLHRAGDSYELETASGHNVWVNGERVAEAQMLHSGDLLEIGRSGPVLRFRTYPAGTAPRKTLTEAFADSLDGAKADGHSRMGRITWFLTNITKDLATQTSLWFRIWVLILLTALVVSVVVLVAQSVRLQKRVAIEGARVEGMAELLKRTGAEAMKREHLLTLQTEVERHLAANRRRIEQLEARSDRVARLVSAASPSVVFVQGAFGFIDPETQRPLRYMEPDEGIVVFTMEEQGRRLELMFSGSAFVVSEKGVLLTNRHVAQPWRDDPDLDPMMQRGLTPAIWRLLAYFPDRAEPLELQVEKVSEQADLALLRISGEPPDVRALELREQPPTTGDEVLVLGYPMGARGLMVRASAEFIEAITPNGDADLWTVVQRLSEAGYIQPLATRGIVSQVSKEVVAYDAETTVGGSGGPVLNMEGFVVGITAAIITQFGGSNLGVPVRLGIELLRSVENEKR